MDVAQAFSGVGKFTTAKVGAKVGVAGGAGLRNEMDAASAAATMTTSARAIA